MAETWRVVLASGEVREVEVALDEHGWSARTSRDRAATRHRSAEMAVRRLVATYLAADFDVREILAPGELTRAELRAQAWREGAEAMREACVECAAWDDDRFDGYHAPDVSDDIERAIRTLPVPPCPEVSR